MKQLLRTVIETADLIKNEQTQNDANEEITEAHIKQAIEQLGKCVIFTANHKI